jgi:hypothetical protein
VHPCGNMVPPACNLRRLTEPWHNPIPSCQHLRHDKNFVGPGIFNFGSRRVTAHVYVSAARVKWTKHVSWFVWHSLSGWECVGSGGRLRRRGCPWLRLCRFAVSDRRSCFGRLLSCCLVSLSPWLWGRGYLCRWSRVTRLGHVGFDCIRCSDHGWLVTVALKSVMHRRGRNTIRTDGHITRHVV